MLAEGWEAVGCVGQPIAVYWDGLSMFNFKKPMHTGCIAKL